MVLVIIGFVVNVFYIDESFNGEFNRFGVDELSVMYFFEFI